MTAMTANNMLSMTRGEVAQIEREAAERKLLRAIQARKRLEAMKAEIPACRPTEECGSPERVDFYLMAYREWVESGRGGEGGYIDVAVGLTDGGTSKDIQEMVRPVDRECARKMFEILHCKPPVLAESERMAILIDLGQLPNVFNFREPLEQKLAQAKRSIGAYLKAKGWW